MAKRLNARLTFPSVRESWDMAVHSFCFVPGQYSTPPAERQPLTGRAAGVILGTVNPKRKADVTLSAHVSIAHPAWMDITGLTGP